jgi:predicted negative regulator of RcsB-dependent stress response
VEQASLSKDGVVQKTLRSQASQAFSKLIAEHPNTFAAGQAMLELAKLLAVEGHGDKALAELRQFLPAGSQASQVVAPLGLIQLALLLRERHEAQDAVRILQEGIKRWEAPLTADLEKQEWLWLLKYHLGLSLDETRQHSLARSQYEDVANRATNRPLALEAYLRFGKSRVTEGQAMMKLGAVAYGLAGTDNNKRNAAQQKIDQGRNMIADAANQFHQRGDQFQQRFAKHEARARLYYEAVWAWRSLTPEETRRTRDQMRYEAVQKRMQDLLKQPTTAEEKVDNSLPKSVPLQQSENSAKYAMGRLMEQFPDTRLAITTRLEQAEQLAERGEHERVVNLLETTIDREPTDGHLPESTRDGLRLRLADSLVVLTKYVEAVKVYQLVGAELASPMSGRAKYAAAECFNKLDQPTKAITELLPFRDQPEWAAKSGLADIGLLRLGQLYTQTKQHDAGVKCLQKVTGLWATEASYAIGCSEAALNQPDKATATLQKLLSVAGPELQSRVLCQLGRLQLTERKADLAASSFLAAVSISPAKSEIQNLAQLEAARAMFAGGDAITAKILLQTIMAQSPESRWASAAKLRLEKLR